MELQATSNECGIYCMKMVLERFGKLVDKEFIDEKVAKVGSGLSLMGLAELGTAFGLSYRAVRVSDTSDLNQLTTPCILHWNMNHYVVLLKSRSNALKLYDPGVGIVEVPIKEAVDAMTGVAMEFSKDDEFTVDAKVATRKKFPLQLNKFKFSIVLILLLTGLSQAASLGMPLYSQFIIDNAIGKDDISALKALILGMVLIALSELLLRFIRMSLSVNLTIKIAKSIGDTFIGRLIRLDSSYFSAREIGDTLTRYQSLTAIRSLITKEYVTLVVDAIVMIIAGVVMYFYSPLLCSIALGASALYIVLRAYYLPIIRIETNRLMQAIGAFETKFIEVVGAHKALKTLSAEGRATNCITNRMVDTLNNEFRLATLGIKLNAIQLIYLSSVAIATLYMAGTMVITDKMTIGMLFAYLAYLSKFSLSLSSSIDNYFAIKAASVHFDRIAAVENAKLDVSSVSTHSTSSAYDSLVSIDIQDLAYSYEDSSSVFSQISFSSNSFSIIAVAGPSGCGKSTLLHCIAGLTPPDSGTVHCNGHNIAEDADYRHSISGVFQEDTLITGTVVQNITFFDVDFDLEFVKKCAQIACIDEAIESMPMGYHTPLYGTGSNISGGQAQRVLLARALYKKPKLIFLDEALNQVSTTLEKQILNNIKSQNIKIISVAHRKENLYLADSILGFPGWKDGYDL
ncbi:peptidase domain-containing ABC transporter [Teredinibacter purpureus]|uniref:peptidase domain-containing ABC transporter n=1 Tax=Teredinibacter purpureus TaxID=2731756 RepID=UPI000A47E45F|nr:peptidase domain-containing ABC transporter [Teredinibacter purpureus]